jgi:imidazoleglycerol-phosphate dehydratase
MSLRKAQVQRTTKETNIALTLALEGSGKFSGDTGVGFLNHMLELLARHGLFDLQVEAKGDRRVDDHHTVEDVGICLGQALKQALGDKEGIRRFGDAAVPMEDALAQVAVDIGGRPGLAFNVAFPSEKVGSFDTALVREFLQAFASNAAINLHIHVPCGANAHHVAEAIFKALARALDDATRLDPRRTGVPSTKGIIC